LTAPGAVRRSKYTYSRCTAERRSGACSLGTGSRNGPRVPPTIPTSPPSLSTRRLINLPGLLRAQKSNYSFGRRRPPGQRHSAREPSLPKHLRLSAHRNRQMSGYCGIDQAHGRRTSRTRPSPLCAIYGVTVVTRTAGSTSSGLDRRPVANAREVAVRRIGRANGRDAQESRGRRALKNDGM